MAEAEAKLEDKKRRGKRSRSAERVVELARAGVCVALIAAEVGLTKEAVRSILARAGVSIRALRAARAARREIQPYSPAAELLVQANDVAVAEIRAAAEERRPIHADWEPGLRAQGFPVARHQHRRAAKNILAELRAQVTAQRSHQIVMVLSPAQERAVQSYLAECGLEEAGGIRYYGARPVCQERGRRKYLVPAAALEAIAKATAAAGAEEDDEWIDLD